ncbi:MAG: trigger factor [Planctomycetota bacterium]
MEVTVAETGPCSRTLTIQVPSTSVREHIDAMYRSANQQVSMKGFRPGKVPRKMLEKHLGANILKEAKEQLVQRFFQEACRDKEILPVGRIAVDGYEQLEVKADADLNFTVQLDVRPKFEVGDVKGLEAARYETEVKDEEIDGALKEISNQKRSIQKVQEPAQKGDFVRVDMRFLDEAGATAHERKGVQLNTNIPVAGTDPAEFEKALTGAETGKPVELPMTFPDTFEKEQYRGKPGKAVLDVLEVLRVSAPPIDDELAKGLDFPDLAALREDLRTRIGQEKERVGKLRQEDQCLQQLLERHQFAVPQSLVDDQQQASLRTFAHRLKEQGGLDDKAIQQKLEESKDEARTDAERRVRLFFLVDAIARQEKLFVTENDMETEIRNIAQANSATPDQVREYLERNNQIGELRLSMLERKVRDFLREKARIVDKSGT